jgi:hypothetical protein
MNHTIANLEKIRDKHGDVGKQLFIITNGRLFPCHALYYAVLNRSLEIFDGFLILFKNDNYGCCMALLRIQLDNVLRFYGVLHTKNIHYTANKIFLGRKLDSMKDKRGNNMKDSYLVKLLSKSNPWIAHVYKLTCGYIHLSDQHIHQMLEKSPAIDGNIRDFYIKPDYTHINIEHKNQMINAFLKITEGIFDLFLELEKHSNNYNLSELEKIYPVR